MVLSCQHLPEWRWGSFALLPPSLEVEAVSPAPSPESNGGPKIDGVAFIDLWFGTGQGGGRHGRASKCPSAMPGVTSVP